MRNKRCISGFVVAGALIFSVAVALATFSNGLLGWASQRAEAAGPVVRTRDFALPTGYDPWGTAFDSTGRTWLAVPDCDPTPKCSGGAYPGFLEVFGSATSSWLATYQLPAGYGQPFFLNFASSGLLWFAMPMTNAIGRFDPFKQTFSQWTVPTPGAGPWDIVADHNGKIWFTEHYTNKIGRFDPLSGKFMEISTPALDSQPYGITVDAFNNAWFTENNDTVALIGEYTAGGRLLEYKIRNGSTSGLTPHLIVVDPNGNVWWSEGWAGALGELRVASARPGTNNGVNEYAYDPPCGNCGTHTSGIGVDSNGNVWFDDSLQSIYGVFPDSGTGNFTLYSTPTPNSHPHDGLRVDAHHRIWMDEEFANKLVQVLQPGSSRSWLPPRH